MQNTKTSNLADYYDQYKIFNDPIHGSIEIPLICCKFMDTPEFQRLRDIKQLGAVYHVYPGAAHNRFEHSIGTCYLAGQMAHQLQRFHGTTLVTNTDIICVQIAALLHDLGHGPFSHAFQDSFLSPSEDCRWKHEDMSQRLFEQIVNRSSMREYLEKHLILDEGISLDDNLEFIKVAMVGLTDEQFNSGTCPGRKTANKTFLYEIVANRRTGVDVDKFDYVSRDAFHLGLKSTFDHRRYISHVRICNFETKTTICCREKDAESVIDLFAMRNLLHRRAYNHNVKISVELMIVDAFEKADKKLKLKEAAQIKENKTYDDYVKLSDCVFYTILFSTDPDPDMVEAKELLKRVIDRDLYICMGQTNVLPSDQCGKKDRFTIAKELSELAKTELGEDFGEDQFVVHIAIMTFGLDPKNPMENLRFYRKQDSQTFTKDLKPSFHLTKDQVTYILPNNFAERRIFAYCKKKADRQICSQIFSRWCENNGLLKDKSALVPTNPD